MPVRASKPTYKPPGNKASNNASTIATANQPSNPFAIQSSTTRGSNGAIASVVAGGKSSLRGGSKTRGPSSGRGLGASSTTTQGVSRGSSRGSTVRVRGSARGGTGRTAQRDDRQDGRLESSPNSSHMPPDQRLQSLKKSRAIERQAAIDDGLMADPDVPRQLSEAITLVGTCDDMCPEYERVTRMVQNDVWRSEYSRETVDLGYGKQVVAESRMVKKFRRPAAGIEEQIPSDLRPPKVLQKTVAYLVDEVVGAAHGFEALKEVHNFVWDRTRGIRNDFSVQQLRDVSGLQIAIDCFERIVRFHLLTRHQIGGHQAERGGGYDHQQDLEQCIKGLISLVAYYDLARDKDYISANEAEFRAYWIITRIPEKREQDVEAKVQSWPKEVQVDARVKLALELYAAACNASNPQTSSQVVAQQNSHKFWSIVASTRTSYLMACTAEIFFDIVRKGALFTITQSCFRGRKAVVSDWTLTELCSPLGFDTEDEVREYVEAHGFELKQDSTQQWYLDIASGKSISYAQIVAVRPPRIQSFSESLVEYKRFSRSLPAIINGLPFHKAADAGLLDAEDEPSGMSMEQDMDAAQDEYDEDSAASLFVPMINDPNKGFLNSGVHTADQPVSAGTTQSKLNVDAPAFNPFAPGTKAQSPSPSSPFEPLRNSSAAGSASTVLENPFALSPASTPSVFGLPNLGQSIFSKPAPPATTIPVTTASPSAFQFAPPIKASISAFADQESRTDPLLRKPSVPPSGLAETPASSPAASVEAIDSRTQSSQTPKFAFVHPIGQQIQDKPEPNEGFTNKSAGSKGERPATASIFSSPKAAPSFFSTPKSFMNVEASGPFSVNTSKQQDLHQSGSKPQTFVNVPATIPKFTFSPTSLQQPESASIANLPTPAEGAKHVSFDGSINQPMSSIPNTEATDDTSIPSHAQIAASNAPRSILKTHSSQSKPSSKALPTPQIVSRQSDSRVVSNGPGLRKQRYDECADYLARQLLLDSSQGLLYQYIAYSLQPIFDKAKAEMDDDTSLQEVNNFRHRSLVRRYGMIWRHKTIASMKKKQATSRRQRMHEASMRRSIKLQSSRAPIQANRIDYDDSMNRLLDTTNRAEKLIKNREAARKVRFQKEAPSSLGVQTNSEAPARDANGIENSSSARPARPSVRAHRRSKTSVEQFSSQLKNQQAMMRSSASSESLRRSDSSKFLHTDQLADSLRSSTLSGPVSTFSSNYFKLKARGLTRLSDAYQDRNIRKRQRVSSDQEPFLHRLHSSLSQSDSRSPSQEMDSYRGSTFSERYSISSGTKRKAAAPLTSLSSTKRSKEDVTKEDEELFARARAVQTSLSDGISVYQSEIETLRNADSNGQSGQMQRIGDFEDEKHPLFNASVISFASPKQAKPKQESRAVLAQSMRVSKDADVVHKARDKLPAFWFRESKFVPRSEYGLAPTPKRARLEQTFSHGHADERQISSPASISGRMSAKSNHNHIDLAQGGLSNLSNGRWQSNQDGTEAGQGHASGEAFFLDDLDTNRNSHSQQYDEAFLQQDFARDEYENGDGATSEGSHRSTEDNGEQFEEEYDDFLDDEEDGHGFEDDEEESDEDDHVPPDYLQGGNSIEDAIEL